MSGGRIRFAGAGRSVRDPLPQQGQGEGPTGGFTCRKRKGTSMSKTVDPAEADIDELRVFAAVVAEEAVDLSRMDPTTRADLILLHQEFAGSRDKTVNASLIPRPGDYEQMGVVNRLIAEGKIQPHWARWAQPGNPAGPDSGFGRGSMQRSPTS